jgi:circadian clock protein KaiB
MTETTESEVGNAAGSDRCRMRLYVAGQSTKSLRALVNLKTFCDEHLAGEYDIEIIDLAEHPSLALVDDIVAIPTLVLRSPPPLRKVIGDLSNTERVLQGLQLQSAVR